MAAPLAWNRTEYPHFAGGIHDVAVTGTTVSRIALGEVENLENFEIADDGALVLRFGAAIVNTTALVGSAAVTGIFQYRRFSGQDDTIVTIAETATNSRIYRRNTGTVTFTSLQPSAGIARAYPTFALSNDLLVIGFNTSTQELLTWNGSAAACVGLNSASAPQAGGVADYNNHLVAVDVRARPGSWEFSVLGDPTSWRASDRVDVDRPTIMGLPFLGNFVIFADDRIIRISGDDRDNFRMDSLSEKIIGPASARAIVNVQNQEVVIWQGRNGRYYEYDGASVHDISRRVAAWFAAGNNHQLNTATLATRVDSVNFISGQRVGFLFPDSTTTRPKIAWYSYAIRTPDPVTGRHTGAWFMQVLNMAGVTLTALGSAIENGTEIVYAGTNNGQLIQLATGATDVEPSGTATTFTGTVVTGPFGNETPEIEKRWRQLYISADGTLSRVPLSDRAPTLQITRNITTARQRVEKFIVYHQNVRRAIPV